MADDADYAVKTAERARELLESVNRLGLVPGSATTIEDQKENAEESSVARETAEIVKTAAATASRSEIKKKNNEEMRKATSEEFHPEEGAGEVHGR